MASSDSVPLSPLQASDAAPLAPTLVPEQSTVSIPEDGGDVVPEVETPTGGDELSQVESRPPDVADGVSVDFREKILTPDDAVPNTPLPDGGVGQISSGGAVPSSVDGDAKSISADEVSGLTQVGDGGLQVSSTENSPDGCAVGGKVEGKEPSSLGSVQSEEKDGIPDGGLSEDAIHAISEDSAEKKALGVEEDSKPVVFQSTHAKDQKIEAGEVIDAAINLDKVEKPLAIGVDAINTQGAEVNDEKIEADEKDEKIEGAEEIEATGSLEVAEKPLDTGTEAGKIRVAHINQISDDATSCNVIEDLKSSYLEANALDPSIAGENGESVLVLDEEEEFFDAATQTAPADGIVGVYEVEADELEEGFGSDVPARVAIIESSETAKQIIQDMDKDFSSRNGSSEFMHDGDGEIVVESDDEVDTDEDGNGEEIFDSAALTALLKAAAGVSPDGNITLSSQGASKFFSADPPAGLGSSVSSLKPTPQRSLRSSIFTPADLSVVGDDEIMDEAERKLHDKVEQIRVKFLRLVLRLGHSPDDIVAAQVLHRLGLAEGMKRARQTGRAFSAESAKRKAMQLEVDGKEDLDFSCNILVLGKTGVGKSATINSIFGDLKTKTNAFKPATTYLREISGTLEGIKIRVVDTPGLSTSAIEQSSNRKILISIKKFIKRCPPDIVLYVDRLDTQTRNLNDLPLLRSITSILGSSIWFNAIVALTHAASAPPEGPNGSALSYEMVVAQRSHVVQQCIRQAAGDMRLMNPVALVENHPSCRRNKEGERVLPNGKSWRTEMLLLCYSSKILSEANSLLKLQDSSSGKLFNFRFRSPPLPYLLSSLLQSRTHPKLSAEQGGENDDSDIDLDDLLDVNEEEDEYDQLPPFKPLKKAQLAKLTKEQRNAYFDEYDYRVKLIQKKQWKEELRRIKEMKKRGKIKQDDLGYGYGDMGEDDQEGSPAAVPVPLPDMALPPSFDCDNPVHRYRFLEPTSQLLTRPVLDTHGWDHDCGYDGVSIEQSLALANYFPGAIAIQVTKDKKEFSIQLDSSICAKHGENGSTLAGFDIQSVGRQLAYILRGETKFKNFKKNKTAGGISVTFLGETIATGLKVEDQITIGKRVNLVASTGAIRAQGDVALGANLEARLRDKDYPIGQSLSTLGLSLMKWHGDLALGTNLQSQFSIGRNSKMAIRVGLNNKLSGQITIKTSTSEQLQMALLALVPTLVSLFRSFWAGESFLAH
ncbi:translocase of chloroplast 101, chloroplastic-like [Zingiber officinale]|uniref:translocase of chloroplast 101, chloroplastic-like n=1 Tax=Zingiber officinale TaxID=94328 RepID=UPI001C4AE084|nr:translocase of chloroplast 101, chloroplastic-like [Zingiber officinale]